MDHYITNDTCLVRCLKVHSKFSEWFCDLLPVQLAACLKQPSRANYHIIKGVLKGRDNATRIMVQPSTYDLSNRKNDVSTLRRFNPRDMGMKHTHHWAGPSPTGGPVVPAPPHLKSVPPHFTFGPPVAAYIQYCILKMCPPPSGFWPPLLLNPGDGPVTESEQFATENQAALISHWIRAVEHRKCAAGVSNAHPDLQNPILLNCTWIENAHKVRKKTLDFLLCIEVQSKFLVFLFPCWDVIKCLIASMLTTAVFELVQQFYHATEIANVANAVSTCTAQS